MEVATAGDLEHARPVPVKVRGREVFVVRWHDEFFVVRNICAHQSAMLSYGWVQAELVQGKTFYEIDVADDSPVVRCPWHSFRFRLRDGRCIADPDLRVRSYKVVVADGKVYADLSAP